MATAVRALKAVRPHIPMIKFPLRGTVPESSPAAVTSPAVASPSSPPPSGATSKPIGSTPRGSGIDSLDLPNKYHRKPIDLTEMEFIERGGPA